ncbi:cytochrome P450 [Kitasatospora purpeofusca]|uniref:Cytochrome P450 n=1 Tax=Kitasatospora purpeofusca TaxID=67352 RepID=A0ABZ1TRA1_9ACTN|nr:cytochrome P450 [Kitasatospora purpeofusca]
MFRFDIGALLPGRGRPGPQSPVDHLAASVEDGREIARVTLWGKESLLVNDPALINDILVARHHDFGKVEGTRKGSLVSANGILSTDDTVHLHHRRLHAPTFRKGKVEDAAVTMRETAESVTATWRHGRLLDVVEEMCRITAGIALATLFADLGTAPSTPLREQLPLLIRHAMEYPMAEAGPTGGRRRRTGPGAPLTLAVKQAIRQSLAECEGHGGPGSIVGALRADNAGPPHGLSRDDLVDEILLFMIASSVTNATTLSWAFHELARTAGIADPVRAAAVGDASAAGGGPAVFAPGYADRVVMEVLRLHPPVWILSRQARTDTVLGGWKVASGTVVHISPYTLHRKPDLYADPQRFDPDRWLGADLRHLPPCAYLPFAAGPRGCIGEAFAKRELATILTAVAGRWRLAATSRRPAVPVAGMTLHPHRLVMMPYAHNAPPKDNR